MMLYLWCFELYATSNVIEIHSFQSPRKDLNHRNKIITSIKSQQVELDLTTDKII